MAFVITLILFFVLTPARLIAVPPYPHAQNKVPLYLEPNAPLQQRVDDLVGRMTLEEKVSQMQNEAPAIPRLHVPSYDWWNEGLHGMARSGYATVFPQAIGLAATWDTGLIERVSDVISTEARAKYNEAQRVGNDSIFYGLTIWSPNINIVRDPRWGRGQETYGEDPFLTGRIGSAFVRGLQGDNPKYLKTVATAKHFAVHSGPESERHTFDAVISPHDLEDTYLPAFHELVTQAHVDSVMCAYNAVDGAPACANTMLLQQKLKQHWGFNGFVVSDCAAISDVSVGHKYASDLEHAAAVSVKAGTDLSCGKEYAALADTVRHRLIPESDINASVRRLFTARFRLGMFDPAGSVPFNKIPFSQNDSPQHAQLSLEAARASMVLLKNEHEVLPLRAGLKNIAVIGPNADTLPALEGNYNGVTSHPVTPLEALRRRMPGHVRYAQGSAYVDGAVVPLPETLWTTDGEVTPGLRGEYFSGTDFKGAPVVTRIDRRIDFDWNGASPAPGVSAKAFAVRWTGMMTAPAPGKLNMDFAFAHCSTCEDAERIKVWLDGKQVYDYDHAATHGRRAPTPPFQLTFADTRPHRLCIEYTHQAPHFGAGLTLNWRPPLAVLRQQAVVAASQSDAVILFLGLSPELEGEEMPIAVKGFRGGDRTSIELPDAQQQLVSAIAATGKPIVMVLMNGSAIALGNAAKKAAAILEAWYPGQAGGTAIAETLFGENNPSGRLPITFYASTAQLPPFDDYSMNNRTYRYFSGEPLYSFGYGLSYTRFDYSAGELSTTTVQAGQPLKVQVEVKNKGKRDGTETIEAYLIPEHAVGTPLRELVGFQKMQLHRGENKTVQMTLTPRELSLVAADGTRSVEPGEYKLYIGGGQPGQSAGIMLRFQVVGHATVQP
jgi:beta-glucosidase